MSKYIYNGAIYNETIGHELLPLELIDSISSLTKATDEDIIKCTGSYGVFNHQSASMVPRIHSYRNDYDIMTELTLQIAPDEWVNELEKYADREKINIDVDTFREKRGFILLHSHELSQKQQLETDKVMGEGLSGILFENGGKEFDLICCGYLDITEKGFPAINMPWEGRNLNYIIISNNTAKQLEITPYIYSIAFNTSQQEEPKIKRKLQGILAEFNQETESYPQYYLIAKSDILAEERSYILAVRVVTGIFNGVLVLFAVLGYCNIVITGIIERQVEFAIMRSVGMTRKQLKEMLIWEGIFYCCCITGLSLSLGNTILITTGAIMRKNIRYFTYNFPMSALLCFLILLLVISVGIPLAAYSSEGKRSVIERLRNTTSNG